MARGLLSSWKVPIYFSGDEPMTVALLEKIILALEEKSFTVRGVAFDLGNKEFVKQTNIKNGNYYLLNPFDKERHCYLMPDVPHLLKETFRKI